MLNPLKWLKEGVSLKGKIIIAAVLLCLMVGGGIVAYKFYDFTQNNPKFCVSCHLMQPAYDAWAESVHKDINCHDCHHLTIPEQNQLLVTFVLDRPTSVPDRHGKVIVPSEYCIKCHWEQDERYPDTPQINDSTLHAKHFFKEKIACAKCHGYIVHQFTPEESLCLTCHNGKKVVGAGMGKLACLNCHTDRTKDLRPDPEKCLFCHGGKNIREELIGGNTLDVTHYQPDEATIKKATKIRRPDNAPMQFDCVVCHKPHEAARPDWSNCLDCHKNIVKYWQASDPHSGDGDGMQTMPSAPYMDGNTETGQKRLCNVS